MNGSAMLRPKPLSNSSIEGAPGYEHHHTSPYHHITTKCDNRQSRWGNWANHRVEPPSSGSNSVWTNYDQNHQKHHGVIKIIIFILPHHHRYCHPPPHDDHAVNCNLSTPQCHRLVGSETVYRAMVPNSPRPVADPMKYEHLRF